jgi:hypothetical protein
VQVRDVQERGEVMETKQGPTPGPWQITGATGIFKAGEHWADIATVNRLRPSHGNSWGNSEPAKYSDPQFSEECANARLIAAAPDLRDALLLFIDIWNSGDASKRSKRAQKRRVDMWDKVNAALEKAGVQRG